MAHAVSERAEGILRDRLCGRRRGINMTEREAKKELLRRAKDIDATVRVGKDGVTENLNNEIVEQLKKKRLIKVKVLNNSDSDTKDVAEQITTATGSVAVDVRGGVILLADKRTWDSMCQKKFD